MKIKESEQIDDILQDLEKVDTQIITPEIIRYLRLLFVCCGKLLRKGNNIKPEVYDYVNTISVEILTDIFTEIFDSSHFGYDLYTYNSYLDNYLETQSDEMVKDEKLAKEIDKMAEEMLLCRNEYDLILAFLADISTKENKLRSDWLTHFEQVESLDDFLMNNLYVRPQMLEHWVEYVNAEGLSKDGWWVEPMLVQNRPVLLPMEVTDREIDSLDINIPEHVLDKSKKKIFAKTGKKNFDDIKKLIKNFAAKTDIVLKNLQSSGWEVAEVLIPRASTQLLSATTKESIISEESKIGNFAGFHIRLVPKGTAIYLRFFANKRDNFKGLKVCIMDEETSQTLIEHFFDDESALIPIKEDNPHYDLEVKTDFMRRSLYLALIYGDQNCCIDIK